MNNNQLKTVILAFVIFLIGFLLSLWSPKPIACYFMMSFLGLSIALIFLLSGLPKNALADVKKAPLLNIVVSLMVVQTAFFILSALFFSTIIEQTQLNPRLTPLEPQQLLSLFQDNRFLLGFCPWLLYAALGVGFAYFAKGLKRTPTFANVIVPKFNQHPKLFLHFYILVITYAVILFPILFVTTLSLIWLSDAMCAQMNLPSLFQFPIRTIFTCAMMQVFFHKVNTRLLAWMQQKRLPLGAMLSLYVLILSFFLVWVHGFAVWFFAGVEFLDPTLNLKSILLASLSEVDVNTRLTLLIWGWFGVWIPWMSSVVARMAISAGIRPILIFILTSIYPLFIVYCVNHFITNHHWDTLLQTLSGQNLQMIVALSLLLFMMMMWGRDHTTADLERGAMFPIGNIRTRSLSKWMQIFILILSCYFVSTLLLGWVPTQIIATLGAGFMVTLVFGFTVSLSIARYRSRNIPKRPTVGLTYP